MPEKESKIPKWLPWVSIVIVVIGAILIFRYAPSDPVKLQVATGYVLLLILFFSGVIVLALMATGAIDITELLEDDTGGASMSRFQLLVFTFVIALSFFLLVSKGTDFPQVNAGVLTLLGISATTYGVSKSIANSNGGGAAGQADKNKADKDKADK
jgi:ABC-type Mn2+/Zn2+ transport system permease subunit